VLTSVWTALPYNDPTEQDGVLTSVWTALPYNDPTEQDGVAVTSVSGAWFESRPQHLDWLMDLWFSARNRLTLRLLMSYIYMELLVKPEMLTSYIYGPTFGNAETVSCQM